MAFLDDFREEADDSELFAPEPEETLTPLRAPQRHFLGMTPPQRFVIAVMLLMMSCILSSFCLLVMEKVIPPFL